MWRVRSVTYWIAFVTLLLGWVYKDFKFVGIGLSTIAAREKTNRRL